MLSSVCRFASTRRVLTGAAGAALLTASMAGPAAAEDSVLGYTDLRLSFGTMPWDGYNAGPAYNRQSGNFDNAFRLSVMAIGPLCGILPIGCATPPRIGASTSRAQSDAYGTYDDLAIEQEFIYYDRGYSYDTLIGFELSYITMDNDGALNPLGEIYGAAFTDPLLFAQYGGQLGAAIPPGLYLGLGFGEPDIQIDVVALTMHIGWGFEVATRTRGRWHWEFTPFLGVGIANVDWVDGFTGEKGDESGLFYELGARVGTYYTFPMGLQIGAHMRGLYANIDADLFNTRTKLSTTGVSFAADIGWRF